jgi:AcrR family transcriptional regulator
MARMSGRSGEDTRRLLLDAATRVIRRHGLGATLDVIAREAGVSKGGLVYHFASKEALLVALAQEDVDGFRGAVFTQLAEPEDLPGRLTRAYIRASLALVDEESSRERFALLAQLITVPAVLELARADDRRWASDLAADRVSRATQNLVIAAADGAATAMMWSTAMNTEDRDQLQADLLAMVDAAVHD